MNSTTPFQIKHARIPGSLQRMAKNLKFLIVEDEFISRTLLQEMLRPFGDCHIATNGDEAIDVLQQAYDEPEKKYDLVCLDIMMPGKNGHAVLKELRRIERTKGIAGRDSTKVFMVTSLDDTTNIVEALVVGQCEGYLHKPVSRVKLEEHLYNVQLIDRCSL